jgi:hypothetical protein
MHLPVLEHSGREPFVDKPSDYTVRNSPVEKLSELGSVNAIEASINTLPILTTFRKRSPLRVHITLFMGDRWR